MNQNDNFVKYLTDNDRLKKLTSKELVIGLYENLRIATNKGGLEIFLKSLRKVNKSCAIIIWCHRDKFMFEYKPLEQKYNCIFLGYRVYSNTHHVQTRRLYLTKHLLDIYDDFDKVLSADMNDVYFQKDPFTINIGDNDIYCALEINNFSKPNGSTTWNENWLSMLQVKENVYNKEYVICSGTLYGSYSGIKSYLDWAYNNKFSVHPTCLGLDQGYWMEYIYSVIKKRGCKMQHIKNSDILTGDRIPCYIQNTLGNIINNNGQEYIILHQIDRIPGLLEHIRRKLLLF